MLYITFPSGMEFERVTIQTQNETPSTEENRDYFVNPGNNQGIDIQYLVKEALRNNTGRAKSIQLKEGITLYFRKPPNTLDYFLEYIPNKNGKFPMEKEPKKVQGVDAQIYNPASQTRYGTFWDHHAYLSASAEEKVKLERDAQRSDRRKTGDSPKVN